MTTKKTRAELLSAAAERFPDQYAEDITPEDSRSQAEEEAVSMLNLLDDDMLLHMIHYATKPYKTGDVIYMNGEFYKAKTDHTGAFNIASWEYFASIKDWITSQYCNAGSYWNFSDSIYKCLISHTSGIFATDLDAGKWKLISGAFNATATGVDDYVASLTPALPSYNKFQRYLIEFENANTGPVRLDIDGNGLRSIFKNGSAELDANDIVDGQILELVDDGTNFQIIGSKGSVVDFSAVTEDIVFSSDSIGFVLPDRSNGVKYRIFINEGAFNIEVVP